MPDQFLSHVTTQKRVPGDRFRAAFSGIDYAVVRDQRVRYKAVLSIVFLTTTLLFDDWFHFLFLLGMTGLMVVAEIFNSCIAALAIQPQHDTDQRHQGYGGQRGVGGCLHMGS
jgi:diacylglycerol kinase